MLPLTRALLGSLVGACAALAALTALTLYQPAIVLDMDVDLPRAVTSGFYPVERTPDHTFVWTRPLATVTLRGVDRDAEWVCTVRLRGARPKWVTPAQVAIGIDGVTLANYAAGDAYEEVIVTAPRKPGGSAAALTISAAPPYVPAGDPRELGVMLDELRCEPGRGWITPSSAALMNAASAGALFGALFGLVLARSGDRPLRGTGPDSGKPLGLYHLGGTAAASSSVAFGVALLLATGVAAYSRAYLEWIGPVALWTTVGTAAIFGVAARRHPSVHPAARFVLAFSATALCLKMLALLHPSKEVVDAIFQAHRLESVLSGNYFFTQQMPGGVRFPYAIGLYVVAAPWATLIPDHVALLRIVVVVAEAIAAALLYVAVVRAWGDRLIGATAVVLYHAAPLSYVVIGNANLTFAFGQSIAAIAVAVAVTWGFDRRGLLAGLGLFIIAALAFLSHVGVFPLVGLTLFATGLLYAFRGGSALRQSARAVLAASLLAALFAVGSYYAHFPEVWRSLGRVSAAAQPASPAAQPTRPTQAPLGVDERAARAARIAVDAYGTWLIALVPMGLVAAWRRGTDRLTLALAGWGISIAVFLAFRVLAPVDAPFQRYADEFIHRVYGMTLPAVAILGACAFAWTWRRGGAWCIGGCALILGAVVTGAQHWASWFR